MNILHLLSNRAAGIMAAPKPMPHEVTDAIDTVELWTQIIGGSIAGITLLFVGIGGLFAFKHGSGQEFIGKVGRWAAAAMVFGLAGVIAPIFVGF